MSKPKQFRKKPVVIEAIQWTGMNPYQIMNFTGTKINSSHIDRLGVTFAGSNVLIETLEGTMKADIGDWIIKGVKGEFYPCKPDIFNATYDEI